MMSKMLCWGSSSDFICHFESLPPFVLMLSTLIQIISQPTFLSTLNHNTTMDQADDLMTPKHQIKLQMVLLSS